MAGFTIFISSRLESGYLHQKAAVAKLARVSLSQQLTLQAKLLSSVMNHLIIRTKDSGFTVAAGQALGRALRDRDTAKVGEILGQVVKTEQFDSLIALDPEMNVLGTHRPDILPAELLSHFEQSLISRARGIAFANDSADPYAYSELEKAGEEALRALGIEVSEDQLSIVNIHPVFSRGGKVVAVLLGHKLITPQEPSILRTDETGAFGLRIYNDQQILLNASLEKGEHPLPDASNTLRMGETVGGTYFFICRLLRANFRVCVFNSESKLETTTENLVSFIKEDNAALLKWLLGLVAIIMALAVVTTWISSNRIIAPLRHIAYAVHSVAKGNWLAEVGGVKRKDEVGEIARAVAVLQRSMKERERLKTDVSEIERLKSQRSEIEHAFENSQIALRQSLFNISDLVETVESGNEKLAGMAGLASGEADETRLVTSRLLVACPDAVEMFQGTSKDPESAVLESFDRLGETIGTLKGDTQVLSLSVVKLIHEAQCVDRIVKQLMNSVSDETDNVTPERAVLANATN